MRWMISDRADPQVVPVADRHYNRQKIGSPQFAPPGSCIVLKTAGATAFWITSWPFAEYVKHAWPGAWICSAFRNEAREIHRSSDLIREAVAVTRHFYGDPPALGMVTFVDPRKTHHKRDPGRCFRRAGFVPATPRMTKGGLVALQMWPADMPAAEPCVGMMAALDFGEAQEARGEARRVTHQLLPAASMPCHRCRKWANGIHALTETGDVLTAEYVCAGCCPQCAPAPPLPEREVGTTAGVQESLFEE